LLASDACERLCAHFFPPPVLQAKPFLEMKYRHFRHSDQQTIIDLPFLPDYASTGHGTVQAIGHLILSRRGHTAFPEFPTQILHRCHQKKLVAISPYTPKRAMTGAQQWNRAPAESVSTSLLFFFYQAENAKKSKSPSPTLATVACARSVIFLCNVCSVQRCPHIGKHWLVGQC
jgi:hypothetical protein